MIMRARNARQMPGSATDCDWTLGTGDWGLYFVGTSRLASTRDCPLSDDLVVVRQLLASLDRARGANPDRLVDHFEVAVRRARVVDEPRDVAADVGVAAPRAIHAKHPDAALLQVTLLARFALIVVANQLAGVIDDPRAFRDRFCREHAEPVDGRSSTRDFRKARRSAHWNI